MIRLHLEQTDRSKWCDCLLLQQQDVMYLLSEVCIQPGPTGEVLFMAVFFKSNSGRVQREHSYIDSAAVYLQGLKDNEH